MCPTRSSLLSNLRAGKPKIQGFTLSQLRQGRSQGLGFGIKVHPECQHQNGHSSTATPSPKCSLLLMPGGCTETDSCTLWRKWIWAYLVSSVFMDFNKKRLRSSTVGALGFRLGVQTLVTHKSGLEGPSLSILARS